jgi:predicted phosphodiesterase
MCTTRCRVDGRGVAVFARSLLVVIALVSSVSCTPARAVHAQGAPRSVPSAAAPASPLPNAKDSIKFLVVGDTGTGGSAQYQVADQIVRARDRFKFEFAIMLGDNLYGGEDPGDYVKKFEKPYKALLDAGVKFYAALGNHDEPGQRYYKPFNMDGKRYYTFEKGEAAFFVLDSTYMPPPQVQWLRKELAGNGKKWKIAYFHHPIYSSGERHGSEMDLRALVEPLFLQYGVDVVFAGHEHFYERLKPQQGIYYFVQGGSAKLRRGNIRDNSAMTARGFDSDNSFMLVEIEGDRMFFETVSRRGDIVDSGVIPRRETATSAPR